MHPSGRRDRYEAERKQDAGDHEKVACTDIGKVQQLLTDADADTFVKEWFSLQTDRTKLRQKYYGKISKATSSLVAARFLQVENTLGMLIDLNIAAELPLLE